MSFKQFLSDAWAWFLGHAASKAQVEADIKKAQDVADEAIVVGQVVAGVVPGAAPIVAAAAAADAAVDAVVAGVEKAVDGAGK